MKPIAVLLNPPASRPTMRDYYCSSTSKAGYLWQPIDLICQSGYLDRAFDVKLIDAPVLGWDAERTSNALDSLKPALIYGLVGTATVPEDFDFLDRVFQRIGARIFVSGDIARFHPARLLDSHRFLEGIVLDFTSPDLADYLETEGTDRPALALRLTPDTSLPKAQGEFAYPVPKSELFSRLPYRMTFLGRPFASILTNYGCPYQCRYCNSCAIGFALRSIDNLFDELDDLREKGIGYLFVKDFTFNAVPQRAKMILERWIHREYAFRWIGYFRGEGIDDELASLLKRTGCSMVQLGIETANPRVLREVRPGSDLSRLTEGIAALRREHVPCGGHFVLGLPGDDESGFEQTVELAKRLELSYASFNVFTERPGSDLADPQADLDRMKMDPSGHVGTGKDVRPLSLRWMRKAYLRFYLRPAYALNLLRSIRSPRVFASLFSMAVSLVRPTGGGKA